MIDPPALMPVDDWERLRIGDRPASFAVLLPATPPGPVVLAVDASISDVLRHRFERVIVLETPDAAPHPDSAEGVIWDGRHSPLAPGQAGLVLVDGHRVSADALRPALSPNGTFAVLGNQGEFLIYPDLHDPEHIWTPRWPGPSRPDLRSQVRRSIGIRLAWRFDTRHSGPRLHLEGPDVPSLADRVLADVSARTGQPARLVGVETAGHTILRVRGPHGDLAVRLALRNTDLPLAVYHRVADDVPAVAPLMQTELARGETLGCPWVVTRWLPQRRRSVLQLARSTGRRWAVAEELVEALQTVQTGTTYPGWARAWSDTAAFAPLEARDRLAAAMAPLDAGLPTGWCHGDLWPPNVLLDAGSAAVIDWENASNDAPLGLDWLLVPLLRETQRRGCTFAEACVRMLRGELPVSRPVAGTPFSQWDVAHRTALVVAVFVLALRNRSLHDLGEENLRRELAGIFGALDSTPVDPNPADEQPDEQQDGMARRAARGAGWLGLGAALVKGSQTAVLLVLAALLAPSALGLVAIGTLMANIGVALGDLGTNMALVYWRGDVRRAARSAVTVSLAINLAITAVLWFAAPWLTAALHAEAQGVWVIRGLVSVLPCLGVATTTLELLRRRLSFVRRIIPDVVSAAIGSAVSIVLAVQGHGVSSLVVGQIVQGVLTLLLSWVVGGIIWPGWCWPDVQILVRYGGSLTGANLLQLLLVNVDYLIVARVLGETRLGQYSLAFRLAYLPYINVAFVIAGAAFPYLCRKADGAVDRALEDIMTAAAIVIVPLCLGVAVFADELELLGAKWAPAVPAVRWLALYALGLSFGQLLQTALSAAGRPRTTMYLKLLHLLTLALLLMLLAHFGVTLVAVGQVLAVLVATGAAFAVARRQLPGMSLGRMSASLGPVCSAAACMGLVVVTVHAAFPASVLNVAATAALAVVAAATYVAILGMLDRPNLIRITRLIANRA